MLVINHVVLHAMDYLADIVNLENKHAIVVENIANGSGSALYVWNVRVNVVSDDHVGLTMSCDDFFSDYFIEEVINDGDPRVIDRLYDVGGRINTDHCPYLLVRKRSQQNAVVTSNFKYGGAFRFEETGHYFGGIVHTVFAQGPDCGGKTKIITEHDIFIALIDQLQCVAIVAKKYRRGYTNSSTNCSGFRKAPARAASPKSIIWVIDLPPQNEQQND